MTVGYVSGEAEYEGTQSTKKILYVQLPTTSFAGIEIVVDMICTELALKYGNRYKIDVLYTSDHEGYPTEPRQYNVIRRLAKNLFSRMFTLRDVARRGQYDIIVVPQIEATVMQWIACLGLTSRIVMHLHGNPRRERSHWKAKVMFFLMEKLVIRRLACVFGTSTRQLDFFRTIFGEVTPCIWVPNPVRDFLRTSNEPTTRAPLVTFVNVGRFDHQKGQDILIEAFARVHLMRPTARLKLVGYGKDEVSLRGQITRLGLDAVATIEHHPLNPQDALLSSDVFVATSRWEGWSLAICEALRFGLPVIATDCEFGPSEILTDPLLGTLVQPNDFDTLVETMIRYHDNIADERKHAAFRRIAIDIYSVGQVVHVHAKALEAVFAHKA